MEADSSICKTTGTIAHEVAHIASGISHQNSNDVNDWIYEIGDQIKIVCLDDRIAELEEMSNTEIEMFNQKSNNLLELRDEK